MNKLLELLKKSLPENQIQEVADLLGEMFEEARQEIEAEYNKKLTEAYTSAELEIKEAEETGYEGYRQAAEVINDLSSRLERLQEEKDNEIEAGYEEAWEMIKAEQAKNQEIEVEVYKDFDARLQEMRKLIIDKIDTFMEANGAELYAEARREILNDPRMIEHKVALDKIIEITADYISEDSANNLKTQEIAKQLETLKTQMQVVESRNVRLSQQNSRLTEAVREKEALITESNKVEKNERKKVVEKASSRGQKVLEKPQIIAEYSNNKADRQEEELIEEGQNVMNDYMVLAGLESDE